MKLAKMMRITVAFVIATNVAIGQNIVSLEYFIDTDPGYGMGNSVTVTAGVTLDTSFTVNTSAVATGLHSLNTRVQDANGRWSQVTTIPFYVISAGSGNVARAEYFFDSDPGFGNGTPVTITPGTTIDQAFVATTSGLSAGIHIFNMRVQDDGGKWSPTHSTPFINIAGATPTLSRIEYYFDTDPGYGNGAAVPFTPGTNVITSFIADVSSLAAGVHILNMRTRDNGGAWSHTQPVPFIKVSGSLTDITACEYFFDSDPGFGNGISVPFSPATTINTAFLADISGLAQGIHKLNVRTRNASGEWSLTSTLPFFVLKESPQIVAIEYAIDTDPGVGSATRINVTPAASIDAPILVPLGGVTEGTHKLLLRTKDSNGSWSTTEIITFEVCNVEAPVVSTSIGTHSFTLKWDPVPGALSYELDVSNDNFATFLPGYNGMVLADTFETVSGLQPEQTYQFRVRTTGYCVSYDAAGAATTYQQTIAGDSTALVAFYSALAGASWVNRLNWLTGPVASWYGVTVLSGRVTALDLPANGLTGTMPATFASLTGLTSLDLSNNNIVGIRDLTPITSLADLYVSGNRLTFEDLQPNVPIPNFVYDPQQAIGIPDTLSMIEGDLLNLSYSVGGSANVYQWQLDGADVAGLTTSSLSRIVTLADDGLWRLKITNTVATATALYTNPVNVIVAQEGIGLDSLALVDLYNATGGASWTNSANWLSGDLSTWYGVTVAGNDVASVVLPSNGLTGSVPTSFAELDNATSIDLSGNNIDGLPDLSSLTTITVLNVSGNRLTFEDLEMNAGIPGFSYSPQQSIGPGDTLFLPEGQLLTLSFAVGGTANTYQWRLDGADVTGENSSTLTRNVMISDDGLWTLKITNPLVPGLELFTEPVLVIVAPQSLTADSLALVALYNSTGGPSWINNSNWLSGPLSTWFGITVSGGHVTAIALPSNNLQGAADEALATMYYLVSVDLSGNEITALPDLTGLPQLTALDVSSNSLDFASLETNISLINFSYQEQSDLGQRDTLVVRFGNSQDISVTAGGSFNSYQWKLNGVAIPGAQESTYHLAEARRQTIGEYTCEITNSVVPGLALYSAPVTILVSADVSGKLFESQGTAAAGGAMTLFRITGTKGYDTVNVVNVRADGFYIFENILLDEYQILGFADTLLHRRALPTYYSSTLYWEEADTLTVDSILTNIDIVSQLKPQDVPAGRGAVGGVVIDEDHDHGRPMGPKRVGHAPVSVRRVERTGRGQEDVLTLVAYVFTDDNGEFQFTNLPEATYRLNIQYPGFPMDASSDIDVAVGAGLQSEKRVEATVIDGKIVVRELVITGLWDFAPYPADMFPNPGTTEVSIRFPSESPQRTVEVSDLPGRILAICQATNREVVLDVSQLATGIYLVTVREGRSPVRAIRLEVR